MCYEIFIKVYWSRVCKAVIKILPPEIYASHATFKFDKMKLRALLWTSPVFHRCLYKLKWITSVSNLRIFTVCIPSLREGNVFSSVCILFTGGLFVTMPWPPCSASRSWPFLCIEPPPPQDMFKTCSTWTLLYWDPQTFSNLFTVKDKMSASGLLAFNWNAFLL